MFWEPLFVSGTFLKERSSLGRLLWDGTSQESQTGTGTRTQEDLFSHLVNSFTILVLLLFTRALPLLPLEAANAEDISPHSVVLHRGRTALL